MSEPRNATAGPDPGGMRRLVETAGTQVREALATPPWTAAPEPSLVAVGAMGGSAIAADLTAALYRDALPGPMLTVRDYRLPACVRPGAMLLLSSYSGATEETLALAADADARGVAWRALTTGGPLGERAARAGAECRALPRGLPPRAAVYASWVGVTRFAASPGWLPDPVPAWREAADALDRANAAWRAGDAAQPAHALATALAGRFVFVHAEQRLEPLVTRWRNQVNENAKLLAHSTVVPELNHNEVVGWEAAAALAPHVAAVVLRDGLESPANEARLALTAAYLRRQGVTVHEPAAPAGGPLARLAALVLLGDQVSVDLAAVTGVDPSPVRSIDDFKGRLAEWRSSHTG